MYVGTHGSVEHLESAATDLRASGGPVQGGKQVLAQSETDLTVASIGLDREGRPGKPFGEPLAVGRRDHGVCTAVAEEDRRDHVGEVKVPGPEPAEVVAAR